MKPLQKRLTTNVTKNVTRLSLILTCSLFTALSIYGQTGARGLTRVATAFAGKPVLTAEQIEDVVAYLVTLRD
mgnify:CR=1 FL=1